MVTPMAAHTEGQPGVFFVVKISTDGSLMYDTVK